MKPEGVSGWVKGVQQGQGEVEVGEIQAKRAREESRVGRVRGEGVVYQSLKGVGLNKAGRVRGGV